MGSCFPFLSGEDNAQELAPFFPMDVLQHTHTHRQKQPHIQCVKLR